MLKHFRIATAVWTGGDFSFFVTRTPPLFHALHHKTGHPPHGHGGGHGADFAFERRADLGVLERQFEPRNPLPGPGRETLVPVFEAQFDAMGDALTPTPNDRELPLSELDSTRLIAEYRDKKYFETSLSEPWKTSLVGPLGALWFVILEGGNPNSPLARLRGGRCRISFVAPVSRSRPWS